MSKKPSSTVNVDSHVLDAINIISNENNINKEDIIRYIEESFVLGGQKKYGNDIELISRLNPQTGNVKLFRILNVVEEVNNSDTEIDLASAKRINKSATLNTKLEEELPTSFDRTIIERVSKNINYFISNEKKEREYDMFKDRVGSLVKGVVKSVLKREIIVWLRDGTVEAVMDPRDAMFNEKFNIGDDVTAVILNVERSNNKPQVILSRKDESYLLALMKSEIPEIEQDLVSVVKIAREAGNRSKVIVMSTDSRLDPVGACIGGRGARIQAIMKRLNGEKIDIIEYTNDIETLVHRAITPAKPTQVIANEKLRTVDIIVDESQLSLAIGKRGQNVRLVSKVTDYKVDIMTEAQRKEKSAQKFTNTAHEISESLHLDDIVGQILVASGFTSVEDIANSDVTLLSRIEGFDENVAEAIISRSISAIEEKRNAQTESISALKIQNEILELPILTKDMVISLGKAGISKISDIADLSTDEFLEIIGSDLISENDAGDVIMIARRYCYGI